jgi:hypothetical protein
VSQAGNTSDTTVDDKRQGTSEVFQMFHIEEAYRTGWSKMGER